MNSFRFLAVNTISDRIKEILRDMGGPERGKQTRLAAYAGCTKGLINQLLKGTGQQLGHEYAKNVEKNLGYRVDWLLYGTLPKMITDEVGVPIRAGSPNGDEIIELAILYRQSTPEARKRILQYARSEDKDQNLLRIGFPVNDA